MTNRITVWTLPNCQQCRMVKRRLDAAKAEYTELDLSAPENEHDLTYFKGLGYSSAPLTELKTRIVAGYIPAELDTLIGEWYALDVDGD